LRALGLAGSERAPTLPDVPTLKEQGYDVALDGYFGMWFPAKTAPERVQRMHQAVVKALATPAMKKFFSDGGYAIVGSTPAEFAAFVVKDIAHQGAILRRIGITPK
jgi:tripartite-type tricarboxylate transporter receptor subunit TctC